MEILKKIWQAWRRFGQFLGDVLARIVLTLFYFTLFLPFGIGVTLFSDPLHTRAKSACWTLRQDVPPTLDDAQRGF